MLCSDGIEIEWPHSSVSVITISSKQVFRLLSEDIAVRALAHSELTNAQLARLYERSNGPMAKYLVWLGKRLRKYGLENRINGLSQPSIQKALKGSRHVTRLQLLKQIVSAW